MGFVDAIKTNFGKYATFSGRASRSEYWWFILAIFIGAVVISIIETMIFGVPDEAMGEELALVLHLNPGESLTEEALRAYLKERIAGYKVPKHIRFWSEPLPQNASGKLHKLKTREMFLEG